MRYSEFRRQLETICKEIIDHQCRFIDKYGPKPEQRITLMADQSHQELAASGLNLECHLGGLLVDKKLSRNLSGRS